jgi:hypothetical protein
VIARTIPTNLNLHGSHLPWRDSKHCRDVCTLSAFSIAEANSGSSIHWRPVIVLLYVQLLHHREKNNNFLTVADLSIVSSSWCSGQARYFRFFSHKPATRSFILARLLTPRRCSQGRAGSVLNHRWLLAGKERKGKKKGGDVRYSIQMSRDKSPKAL